MNIIDCHCHVYPEKIAPKAVKSIFDFYDMEPDEYALTRGTVQNMLKLSRGAGIGHQIIFSVATKASQVRSINEFIADEVQKSNGYMTGLGTLHPDSPTIKEDVEHLIDLGLKGVKLHPDIQGFKLDDYRCLKIFECCEGRIPVLIHAGDRRYDYSNTNRIIPILEIFNNLTVIAAHLGGWSSWEQASDALSGYQNLYVDCSSCFYWLKPEISKNIIRKYGADRVLFGTDYPMWTPQQELDNFFKLGLTEKENELILYKNASKLFNIDKYYI